MKRLLRLTYFFVFYSIFLGCNTISSRRSLEQKKLSLASAEQMKPGVSSKADVLNFLGRPDKVVSMKSTPPSKWQDEVWMYFNETKDSTRISLVFNEQSTLLKTNWFIESGDPEADLKVSLRGYPSGNFTRSSVPWTKEHFAPNEEMYTDAALGIKIIHAMGNQFVESIVFSKPIQNFSN